MLSLRHKLMAWFFAGLTSITVLTVAAFSICIIFQIYADEKEELEYLAKSINEYLQRIDIQYDRSQQRPVQRSLPSKLSLALHDQPLLAQDRVDEILEEDLDDKISFLFDEKDFNIAYAVFDRKGELLYEFSRSS